MDRIDIVVDVSRVDPALIIGTSEATGSAEMRAQVGLVRARTQSRGFGPTAQLAGALLLRACRLDPSARRALETVSRTQHLSGRGVTRLLRVSRTIADLENCDVVEAEHIAEAVGYRGSEDR